eukprot:4359457-Pyramimonas_sp.AAC.1
MDGPGQELSKHEMNNVYTEAAAPDGTDDEAEGLDEHRHLHDAEDPREHRLRERRAAKLQDDAGQAARGQHRGQEALQGDR